jgi:cytochrome c oxidase subunit 2
MHPGVTPISHEVYTLHMTIFMICTLIGFAVFGVLLYSLIHHRRSKGHEAHDFHESTTVELIWTIIPFLILLGMAIPATRVLKLMDDRSHSELAIKVIGYQWRWEYDYLDSGIRFFSNLLTPQDQIDNLEDKDPLYLYNVDQPLVLPTQKKIRFLFTANDVIHSWWVPQFAVKKDAIPGFINESWAIIEKPGIYHGQCSELCGLRHGYMPIVVEAKTPEEFEAWVQAQKAAAKT